MDSEHFTSGVSRAAWLAADEAFESIEEPTEGDELHHALEAAAPHIRIAELKDLLRDTTLRIARLPLLGKKANGARLALEETHRLLTERIAALEERSP